MGTLIVDWGTSTSDRGNPYQSRSEEGYGGGVHLVGGGGERGSFLFSPSLFIVLGGEVDKSGGTTFFFTKSYGKG